jgi:hypothetical protein
LLASDSARFDGNRAFARVSSRAPENERRLRATRVPRERAGGTAGLRSLSSLDKGIALSSSVGSRRALRSLRPAVPPAPPNGTRIATRMTLHSPPTPATLGKDPPLEPDRVAGRGTRSRGRGGADGRVARRARPSEPGTSPCDTVATREGGGLAGRRERKARSEPTELESAMQAIVERGQRPEAGQPTAHPGGKPGSVVLPFVPTGGVLG